MKNKNLSPCLAGRQATTYHLKPRNGFTLIELLIAATIFAIFTATASATLVSTINMERRASILRKTQQDTRYILETIMREAKAANGEYDKKLDKGGMRITHAYQLEGTATLIIYSTDLQAGTVAKNSFYWADGVIYEKKETKNISTDPAGPYLPQGSPAPLSDQGKIYVEKFSPAIGIVESNKDIAPSLKVTIETMSKEGRDSGKEYLKAKTNLTSSATSRSY